mmetsp:Transcript_6879/g.13188  ORF Transcript_6879/g.13188 Transcript_6879/m.13188 type:complete len:250 (-) Transcript_6879:69-818(-)
MRRSGRLAKRGVCLSMNRESGIEHAGMWRMSVVAAVMCEIATVNQGVVAATVAVGVESALETVETVVVVVAVVVVLPIAAMTVVIVVTVGGEAIGAEVEVGAEVEALSHWKKGKCLTRRRSKEGRMEFESQSHLRRPLLGADQDHAHAPPRLPHQLQRPPRHLQQHQAGAAGAEDAPPVDPDPGLGQDAGLARGGHIPAPAPARLLIPHPRHHLRHPLAVTVAAAVDNRYKLVVSSDTGQYCIDRVYLA